MDIEEFWRIVEGRYAIDAETFRYAPSYAYARLSDGDDEAYYEALEARGPAAGPRQRRPGDWDGHFGEPGDRELIPVRVPRLTALFPLPSHPGAA